MSQGGGHASPFRAGAIEHDVEASPRSSAVVCGQQAARHTVICVGSLQPQPRVSEEMVGDDIAGVGGAPVIAQEYTKYSTARHPCGALRRDQQPRTSFLEGLRDAKEQEADK